MTDGPNKQLPEVLARISEGLLADGALPDLVALVSTAPNLHELGSRILSAAASTFTYERMFGRSETLREWRARGYAHWPSPIGRRVTTFRERLDMLLLAALERAREKAAQSGVLIRHAHRIRTDEPVLPGSARFVVETSSVWYAHTFPSNLVGELHDASDDELVTFLAEIIFKYALKLP